MLLCTRFILCFWAELINLPKIDEKDSNTQTHRAKIDQLI